MFIVQPRARIENSRQPSVITGQISQSSSILRAIQYIEMKTKYLVAEEN